MNTLKHVKKTVNLYNGNYNKDFPGAELLVRFLEEFGDERGIKWYKEVLSGPPDKDMTGNTSTIDKLGNNKIAISDLYSTDPNYQFIIDAGDLLKIMEIYYHAKTNRPNKINVTFDETMLNPTIEIIRSESL